MRRLAFLAAFATLAGTARAQEDRAGDTVSFELKSNIIFVKGSLNGAEDLAFILDTGASVTVLKPATARRLDILKPGERGGSLLGMPSFKKVESIGLGQAQVKNLPVAVMAVPQADLPLALQGINYDGILGYNYLSQFVMTIDYKKKTVQLVPNDYVPEDPQEALRGLFGGRRPSAPRPARTPPADAGPAAPAVHVGLSYATIGDDEANEIGVEGGVVVRAVAPDSPADRAGLRKGDVVTEIGDRRIRRAEDYRRALAAAKPGRELAVTIVRDRKDLELTLVPAERN